MNNHTILRDSTRARGPFREAFWVACGLIAGILCAQSAAGVPPHISQLLPVAGVAVCAAGAMCAGRSGAWFRAPLLVAASFLLGVESYQMAREETRAAGALTRLGSDISVAQNRDNLVALEGKIVSPVWPGLEAPDGGEYSRFTLQLDGFRTDRGMVAARGRAGIRVEGFRDDFHAGDRVRVVARARKVMFQDSDSATHAWFTTKAGAITKTGGPSGLEWIACIADRAREKIIQKLQLFLSGPPLGVAAALTIGTYYYLPDDVLEAHCTTGAIPHLAISGSHVVMVSFAIGWITRRALPRRPATVLLCLILFIYGPVSGGASPTIRAVCAALLAQSAPAGRRRAPSLQLLACGAVLECLVDPAEICGPSFQLSYGAILGFVVFYAGVHRSVSWFLHIPRAGAAHVIAGPALAAMLLGVTATLSTAGIVVYHFQQLPWVAPLAGLPLTLLIPPMLLFAWLAALFPMVPLLPETAGPVAARAFLELCERELQIIQFAAGAAPSMRVLDPCLAAMSSLGFLCILRGQARVRAAGLVLCGFAAWGWWHDPRAPATNGKLQILVHAVGHGLAVTCTAPDGATAQIDAGSADHKNVARQLIQELSARRIQQFDICSVSHADADHANAYVSLLAAVPARAWIADRENPWRRVLARASPDGETPPGDFLRGGAKLSWLRVDAGPAPKDNDLEIVTILEFGGRRVLIPGDLEQAGIAELWRIAGNARFDIALLPHHGLDNGQIESFLDGARPAIVLASCGYRYKTTVAARAAAARGLELLTTRQFGTLQIDISPDGAVEVRGGGPHPRSRR